MTLDRDAEARARAARLDQRKRERDQEAKADRERLEQLAPDGAKLLAALVKGIPEKDRMGLANWEYGLGAHLESDGHVFRYGHIHFNLYGEDAETFFDNLCDLIYGDE